MSSVLLNHYTNANVDFYEYMLTFSNEPIPGEQILIGLDYITRNIIAELRGEQVVVGVMPTTTNTPFRLILTIEMPGANQSYIPYEVYFNFSETINEYTQTLINPFIERIPRPEILVTHESIILDIDDFILSYTSDAMDKVTIEIVNEFSVLVYSNLNGSANDSFNISLPLGTYDIQVIAYHDDLIFTTYTGSVIVEGSETNVYLENYININQFYNPVAVVEPLPLITHTNIIILNSSTVEFTYQTINADFVDIVTNFGQDYSNIISNGIIQFNNLTVNTLYELTIIARDTNSNFDSRDLNFTIIVNIVNNTKGILGLKRGKEL